LYNKYDKMDTVELVSIAAPGVGMVFKSLLLLLVKPEDMIETKYVDEMIRKYSCDVTDQSVYNHIRNFMTILYDDKFDNGLYSRPGTGYLFSKLEKLRDKILALYTKEIKSLVESSEYSKVYDVYAKLENMILQLMRLRMVIQPEFQFSKNVHPVSKIPYIAAKGFWLEDDGKKVRCITKSIGREDEYIDGKNDPKATETARDKLRETLYGKYKRIYPE